jgi:hypothetical protein
VKMLSLKTTGLLVTVLTVLFLAVPAAQASDQYGITPFGLVPRACMHGIPDHSVVGNDGTVYLPDGSRVTFPPCTYRAPFPTNKWVEDAYWYYSWFGSFTGNWHVASAPFRYD